MDTREMKDKFYQIADSKVLPDTGIAHRLLDTIGAALSPDCYDKILAKDAQEILSQLTSQEYKDWVTGILAAIAANKDGSHDLRGYKKNIHN